jgi:uncharacterized protein YggE
MVRYIWAVALAASVSGVVRAEEGGITVTGTAEVSALPDQVEISLAVAGSGELTEDAIVTYESALKRALESFDELSIEGLEIRQEALSIRPQGAQQANLGVAVAVPGGAQQGSTGPVEISRSLRLVLKGVKNLKDGELVALLGKLLDTAKDSGVRVAESAETAMVARLMGMGTGSSPGLTFVVQDAEVLRQEAYQAALAQARQRAGRLATLAGVKLGGIVSIEEHEAAAPSEQGVQMAVISAIYGSAAKGTADQRLTSDKLGPIPLRVSLRVRFAIE